MRGYTDVKFILIDEGAYFPPGQQEEVRAVAEGYRAKTDLLTNATVVDDAIRFTSSQQQQQEEQQEKAKANSSVVEEDNVSSDDIQGSEEENHQQLQQQYCSGATTNQTF